MGLRGALALLTLAACQAGEPTTVAPRVTCLSGDGASRLLAVVPAPDGTVWLAGWTQPAAAHASRDALIVQLDGTGREARRLQIGGGRQDEARAIAATDQGLLIAGVYGDRVPFGDTFLERRGPMASGFLWSIDSEGRHRAVLGLQPVVDTDASALDTLVVRGGEIWAAGWARGFVGLPQADPSRTEAGARGALILRASPDLLGRALTLWDGPGDDSIAALISTGQEVWAAGTQDAAQILAQANAQAASTWLQEAAVIDTRTAAALDDGRVATAGAFMGTLRGPDGRLHQATDADAFVAFWDSQGRLTGLDVLGGTGDQQVDALVAAPPGDLLIAGRGLPALVQRRRPDGTLDPLLPPRTGWQIQALATSTDRSTLFAAGHVRGTESCGNPDQDRGVVLAVDLAP